ncbi:hypothetical protein [Shewanella putrefaciens]|uniref:hypothetical protein n=1 Tax=Shewanella putrefaciens TaxID=24 RepID=UPI003D79650F
MIPNDTWILSQQATAYESYGLAKPRYASIHPYELALGPVEVNQSAGNLAMRYWLFEEVDGEVLLYKFIGELKEFDSVLFTSGAVVSLAASFDQLGKPLVFYDTGTELRLWWYDPLLANHTTTVFGEGAYPFATFDIRWDTSNQRSDVMLLYMRSGAIYYRVQRDRYSIEYTTPVTSDAVFIKEADMAVDYRLQLLYRYRDANYNPPPLVPPVVVPTQGRWAYLLSGYQSYLDSRFIQLQLVQPFSIELTLAQFEPTEPTVCLWSQQLHPERGQLALCFTGQNYDVLRLLYGGSWFDAKLPFGLSAGRWRTEVLWRGNGYGLLIEHTSSDGVVSEGGVIIGRFDSTKIEHAATLRIGAMKGYKGEAIHCLRAAINDVRITPFSSAQELRIAINKKPQDSNLQEITFSDGSASGLGDAPIMDYRESHWLYLSS